MTGTDCEAAMTSVSKVASVTSMMTFDAVGSVLRAAACSWACRAAASAPRSTAPRSARFGLGCVVMSTLFRIGRSGPAGASESDDAANLPDPAPAVPAQERTLHSDG